MLDGRLTGKDKLTIMKKGFVPEIMMREGVSVNIKNRVASLLLALALTVGLAAPALAAGVQEYSLKTTVTVEGTGRKTEVSKGFAIAARVFRGDQSGALNWDDTLTRAEAATMIIRLMGLDEEAQAAASKPCPFTDVPDWAKGYVNLAWEKGVAKGVGEGRFDPSGVCGAREFITMLYRLTHLTEGTDYSWATALEDFLSDVRDLAGYRNNGWSLPFLPQNFANGLENWFRQENPFTREVTADVMYLMLNFCAGPQEESLGDILASEYGMSDVLLYDYYVRRTAYEMRGATSLKLENFTGDGKDVTLSIQNGKLVVDDSRKGDMSVDLPSDSVSAGSPITLPKETFNSALHYRDRFLAGYDEDGDPLYGSKGYTEKFTVTYADGEWFLSKWDENGTAPDYAYIYAYRSDDHWEALRGQDWGGEVTPEIQALADKLTAGKKTELEKADALCEWIATHIYYDYEDLKAQVDDIKDQSAAAVLERRTATCDGYSALTLALLRAAGLECYEEAGGGNGRVHGWNVAYLDGEWVLIDNTWDSALTYEKNPGEGYMCTYDDPELIFEVRAPKNYREPGAGRNIFKTYFHMDYDNFYDDHTIWRQPISAPKAVLNVNHVLPQ